MAGFWTSLGTSSWMLIPFWLAAFAGIGTPLDPQYLGNMYHNELKYSHVDYIAAVLLTLVLALFLRLILFRGSNADKVVGGARIAVVLVSLALAANAVRIYFFSEIDLQWVLAHLVFVVPLAVALASAAWFGRRRLLPLLAPLARLGVIIFVLVLVNVTAAIYKLGPEALLHYDLPSADKIDLDGRAATRVVWFIFDELDERVAFVDRPVAVEMPALDRFRRQTVVADHAIPPGDVTLYSMPTLFLGQRITSAEHRRQNDLQLFAENGESFSWRDEDGVFHDVRRNGFDAALLAQGGHPYCRLFADQVSMCAENNRKWTAGDRSLLDGGLTVTQVLLEHIPLMRRLILDTPATRHPNPNAAHLLEFEDLVSEALKDPSFDLVFVHWNVPHWPFFYDYETDTYTDDASFDQTSARGYLGNLEVTDRVFADAREVLESHGLWQDSAIIVSADHRWRHAENLDGVRSETVPMMIKLPGVETGQRIAAQVESLKTRSLISGLLDGTIQTGGDIENVLTREQ